MVTLIILGAVYSIGFVWHAFGIGRREPDVTNIKMGNAFTSTLLWPIFDLFVLALAIGAYVGMRQAKLATRKEARKGMN